MPNQDPFFPIRCQWIKKHGLLGSSNTTEESSAVMEINWMDCWRWWRRMEAWRLEFGTKVGLYLDLGKL